MDKKAKARWLKRFHQWHWISSAVCLVSMILFSVTGITLNHAGAIAAEPVITERTLALPEPVSAALAGVDQGPLPARVRQWLERELPIDADAGEPEWSPSEVYLALPRAGGDAWLAIDRQRHEVLYEATDRGWIALLNDLHKGRDTGPVWRWFIDIFAAATLVFALTGLVLMSLHAKRRPATWPVTALGLVLPWLLIALFVH
ncbi:PepSY-associated TM helix domain-containing protein [Alloalcanivorax mobilis]|uniref:PepSY-associated TM helix domain-containing protein n=1 Tax=Alloalcanivorax mobilis TaxID=2019569 RepID=UPI000C78171C|nr:PepSY-associated TM helix domain-containing protein [Alloalcanivorax mobilis]